MADVTCALFDTTGGLQKGKLSRFIVGVDLGPRRMSWTEIKSLGDSFVPRPIPGRSDLSVGSGLTTLPKQLRMRAQ
jgi:hypothetical protein